MQLGPMSRTPAARARRRSSSCRTRPAPPASANPAEITHTARTPSRPAWSTTPATSGAGTATSARSGDWGQEGRSG